MAVVTGASGTVTSWGTSGQDCYHLINTAVLPSGFTMSMASPDINFTPLGSAIYASKPGLGSVTGTINSLFPKAGAKTGYTGLLTFSSGGYVVKARNVTLNIAATVEECTGYDAAGVLWTEHLPTELNWGGTYEAFVDDTTAIVRPYLPGDSLATLTVKLSEEGATDNTLAGAVVITGADVTSARGEATKVTYSFRGSGALTVAGSANVLPSGSVSLPDTGTLLLTAASGRTYTGSAFYSAINISVPVGDAITVATTFQGTGAWTIA